jgi:hypothetical protein
MFLTCILPLKDVPAMKQANKELFINQLSTLGKQFSLYFKVVSGSKFDGKTCYANELAQFWLLVKNDYSSL